jgi:hypothetical protein
MTQTAPKYYAPRKTGKANSGWGEKHSGVANGLGILPVAIFDR